MATDASGHVNVPGTIHRQPLRFIVDTGGAFSLLEESAVEALGLSRQRARWTEVTRYGGERSEHYTFVTDFALAALKPGRMPFFIVPDNSFPPGVQGSIGGKFLHRYDAEFDFLNSLFSLYDPGQCPDRVVYWTHDVSARVPFTVDLDDHIRIKVKLDGKDITALVDTGAPQTVGSFDDILDEFGVDKSNPALRWAFEDTSQPHFYHYPFKMLTFDGVIVTNPNIALVPNSFSKVKSGERELIVGMNVLRRLHLYISYSERAMYVTQADAH